ncbi:MAG TPA: TonB-dependent receptor [Pseudosphingobacterium sp.]|nr:TonB-dependent receptor [Pseudosphingobacterium sp.]
MHIYTLRYNIIQRIKQLNYLMLIALLALFNLPLHAQARLKLGGQIDLHHNNATAKEILDELAAKSGYDFSFDPAEFEHLKLTNIYYNDASLDKILLELEKKTYLQFMVSGRHISASINRNKKFKQQQGRIGGKIIDGRGEALPGATIKIIELNLSGQASVDGAYSLSLPAGTYTLEVSYISFQTKRITDVIITAGRTLPLDVSLKGDAKGLEEVVVTADYRRASIEGLYAQQKNAAAITDGISSEQIVRTPDNNMGQVLKRVSGVTTVNDKYVVVRGLSDRYNQAMIDGIVLPSTEMNRRNFSFDVLPQEMVSNVVVNKTATPENSAEFSGGQISVNTLDIPTENFTSITIGAGYNSQSTGKDFLMLGKRGFSDYFAFDDGRREEPKNMQPWLWQTGIDNPPPGGPNDDVDGLPSNGEGSPPYNSFDAIAQSKRVPTNGLRMNRYTALPHQNYRFAIGRIYNLKNDLRFGFVGGVSLRTQQNTVKTNNIRSNEHAERTNNWMDSTNYVMNGSGTSYRFNSTLGSVLNFGIQGKNFKVALKSLYSRVMEDYLNLSYRLNYADINRDNILNNAMNEMFQEPQITWVQQHQVEGEQQLPQQYKLEYKGGITRIGQQILDQRRLRNRYTATIGGMDYFQTPDVSSAAEAGVSGATNDHRMWTDIKETDYNWRLAISKNFGEGSNIETLAKVGYMGWDKQRDLSVMNLIPYTSRSSDEFSRPYDVILDPANMGAGKDQAYYWVESINGPVFSGNMKLQAIYGMLDQHLFQKLRLVYGLRAEYYNLANRQNEYINNRFPNGDYDYLATTGEKDWRFLPSINTTYALTPQMNIRAAYGKTAVRPDFRETSYFGFYDPYLNATITGSQLTSTIIDNVDVRYEWYPTAGEIVSVTGFFKRMKDPIELTKDANPYYSYQNQYAANNYGLEMEIRKSLGFIADKKWLQQLNVFGNGTLIKSKVETQTKINLAERLQGKEIQRTSSEDRPLMGQSPWIVNAGLDYQGIQFGATVSYNRSGPRTFLIYSTDPGLSEYENGRNQLDAQFRGSLLKQKLELRLNLGNLLNEWNFYYNNISAYEPEGDGWRLVNGTTRYEKDKGDLVTYRERYGRTASLTLTYKF